MGERAGACGVVARVVVVVGVGLFLVLLLYNTESAKDYKALYLRGNRKRVSLPS